MTIDLTGIHNVGEFYSHHYLDALLESDLRGLYARWREDDATTPDARLRRLNQSFFRAKRDALQASAADDRYAPSHAFHVELLEALGYQYAFDVVYLLDNHAVPTLAQVQRDGHPYLWIVETPFTDADETPFDSHLLRRQYPGARQSANGQTALLVDGPVIEPPGYPLEKVIGELLRLDAPPRWLLLLAGDTLFLIERAKWGNGQYLLFDLDTILGRREAETLRAAAALLSRDALCPDDGVPLHDTLDENSHKHAYAVSADLKIGVRRAVELLANEYVHYQRTVLKGKLYAADTARALTREALTYLYRLLFIFYAEARAGELDILPLQSDAYRLGYSLEKLRDLELVPLTTPQALEGYFLHESLEQLFRLVNDGFPRELAQQDQMLFERERPVYDDFAFTVHGLQSRLFDPAATPLLSRVKLRNVVLQEVLQLLSLSQEGRNLKRTDRGRISYAQLGINQLGAVYEGLLSYSGFFADERLYVVKRAQDRADDDGTQLYFVPESAIDQYEADEIVYEEGADGVRRRKSYEPGTFIFHLAGRDREKSASYYTPEVLTQCVVKYSLKELLGASPADANWQPADAILRLTLCEPAMGSGAFINEAIGQLADAYLTRKQAELDVRLAPDDYRGARQQVMAYLAQHNAFGVDLNPMATELAQVSLWLNTLYQGMPAPWYGAQLAHGNSLIGARRQVYPAAAVRDGRYATRAPAALPFDAAPDGFAPSGAIFHWLLPDGGMAAFDGDRVIRELAPDAVAAIKQWRKAFTANFKPDEIRQLQQLSVLADDLWQQVVGERRALRAETQEPLTVEALGVTLGAAPGGDGRRRTRLTIAQKEQRLAHFQRPTGPYRRLKLALDYWCALWFWPLDAADRLPTRRDWLADLGDVLRGRAVELPPLPAQQLGMFDAARPRQRTLADEAAPSVDELAARNPRLAVAAQVAQRLNFHHWELAFAALFAERGGFDLILGNPPWVKLQWNETGVLSDFAPQLAVRSMSASNVARQRDDQLRRPDAAAAYGEEFVEAAGAKSYLNAIQNYAALKGVQTNLYKCFIVQAWYIGNQNGIAGLLHPEGIYEDSRGGDFRAEVYPRLKSHFMFQNKLFLFAEVHDEVRYSVNVYRSQPQSAVDFDHMVNLFHPSTVESSFQHDGLGITPGIKNEAGNWDLRGHSRRIVRITEKRLALLGQVFEDADAPPLHSRLPLIHSQQLLSVLEKFAGQPRRLGDLEDQYYSTVMWDETYAQRDGIIARTCSVPSSPEEWVLSGPHIYVGTPFYKTSNETCKHNQDYSRIDLVTMPDDYLPRSVYTPACAPAEYARRTPSWQHGKVTDGYRLAARNMLSQSGERTYVNALLPPQVGHINGIKSWHFRDLASVVIFSALSASVVYDFFVKSAGKSNLHDLPLLMPVFGYSDHPTMPYLIARNLRLQCLTKPYADAWQQMYRLLPKQDSWSITDPRLSPWAALTPHWQRGVALRNEFERRQALVEIDVLAALALGLTLDELLTIYRVQFPVLQQNEQRLLFDRRGYVVPMKTVRGVLGPDEGHDDYAAMVGPFTPVDREADYRVAWGHFSTATG